MARYLFSSGMSLVLYQKKIKDVSREFDEFQVDAHLCKLGCWYL